MKDKQRVIRAFQVHVQRCSRFNTRDIGLTIKELASDVYTVSSRSLDNIIAELKAEKRVSYSASQKRYHWIGKVPKKRICT